MIATAERIAADRTRLAELEAKYAANPNALYVAENLASLRRRVARYGAEVKQAAPIAHIAAPPAVPTAPATPPPPPSREEGLRAVGAIMGGTEEEIAAAIAGGTSPDAFAMLLGGSTAVERVARRIAGAGSDATATAGNDSDPTGVDAMAKRIASA